MELEIPEINEKYEVESHHSNFNFEKTDSATIIDEMKTNKDEKKKPEKIKGSGLSKLTGNYKPDKLYRTVEFEMIKKENIFSKSNEDKNELGFLFNKKTSLDDDPGRLYDQLNTLLDENNSSPLMTEEKRLQKNFSNIESAAASNLSKSKLEKYVIKKRNHSPNNDISKINILQQKLIQDLTFFPVNKTKTAVNEKQTIKRGFRLYIEYLRRIFKKLCDSAGRLTKKLRSCPSLEIPTIRPNGKTKVVWDAFITLFILMKFFFIPVEIGFGIKIHQEVDENFALLNFVTSIFFLCDIPLKFNTGFYHHGNVVIDKGKIVRHYLRSLFVFDLLASVHSCKYIYEYATTLSDKSPSSVPWLNIFFFVKLVELMHLISNFEELLYLDEKIETIYYLFKLFFQTALFTHLIACIWHAVGYFNKTPHNWIDSAELRGIPWQDRYLYSLNWAASALLLTSYGEKISPANDVELVCGILLHFLSAGALCLIIKSMLEIFSKLNECTKNLKSNIRILNRYMSRKNLNYELQDRARKYLNFVTKELQKEFTQKEQEVVNMLSFSLREEVLQQTNGSILKASPIIKDNFSQELSNKLIFKMSKMSYMPDEVIFKENESKDENLYFIISGQILLHQQSKKRVHEIKTLDPGSTFGEIEFFTGGLRQMSAKSLTFSTVFHIHRQEFLNLISEFPLDSEKFCLLRDEILNNRKVEGLKLTCFSCNKNNHAFIDCNMIRYIPEKEAIILKHLYSKPQKRVALKRKRSEKFNSRKNLQMINLIVQDMLMNASFLEARSDNSYTISYSPSPTNQMENANFPAIDKETLSVPLKSSATLRKKSPERRSDEIDLSIDYELQGSNKDHIDSFYEIGCKEDDLPEQDPIRSFASRKFTEACKSREKHLKHKKLANIAESMKNIPEKIAGQHENNDNPYSSRKPALKKPSSQNQIPDKQDAETTNFFTVNIDSVKSYQVYYPSWNIENVLDQIKNKRRRIKLKMTQKGLVDQSKYSPAIIARFQKRKKNWVDRAFSNLE